MVVKMITLRKTLLALITILTLSGTALAAISYTLSTIPNPSSIYTGDSTTVSFSVTNNNLWYNGVCAVMVDSGSWSTEYVVKSGAAVSFSATVYAPPWGNGAGSAQHTVNSYCYDTSDPAKIYKSTSFTLTYTENPKYIANQAINSAQSSINSAQTSINNAQNAITDAKNLGADVSLAESKLSSALNSMQTVQSKQSSANSFYSSSNYNQATNTANDVKPYADSAKTDADTVYSIAIQAKETAQAAKDSAQAAITSAKNVINSASTTKADAQNTVNDAKNIGADVGSAQTFLDTAISKLDSANTKYTEANSYFTNLKWNDAKTSANQAESYANDALTNAGNAKSTANKAKEDYAAEGGQTKSKLDTAQSTYNNVVDTADKTKEAITALSNIGVETTEFTKELETVSSTLVDAKAELDQANTRYENKELSESKSYSEKSLDITEKDITILKDTQNKMASAAIDKIANKYSSISNNYDVAVKTLEDSKTKITGDVYVAEKEKLDNAKKSLDNASNLMAQAKSYADNNKYSDAVISLKGALIELDKANSLSGEIKPASPIPSFETIFALTGLSIAYLVILRRKNIF
ncbi:MAG: hypothetical protein ABOK23_11130 [Candidatus Methanoperedens sp.]|nr:hypothetical protein [Candidatus Methanoperedens sp.]